MIEAGLAAMLTVGVAAVGVLLKWAPPHPANTRRSGNINTIANREEILLRDPWAHVFIAVFPSDSEVSEPCPLDSQVEKSIKHKAEKLISKLRSLLERFGEA